MAYSRKIINRHSMYGGWYTDTILKKNFKNYKNIKFTQLDEKDTANIVKKLQENIPECCDGDSVSYAVILEKLSKNWTTPIFIVGGAVRDYMTTKSIETMNDIDINYTMDPMEIDSALSTLPIKEMYRDERNYIRIGPKSRNDYLEGFYINPFQREPYNLECKMNSLMFMIDYKDDEYIINLVDLFGGEALQQAKNKIWEAPTIDYDVWLNYKKVMLWRLLKFELRDYTVPLETKRAVYQYFIDDRNITDYTWQNLWWTISPDKLNLVLDLIIRDCKESDLEPTTLINKLVQKNLIIANKIGKMEKLSVLPKKPNMDKQTESHLNVNIGGGKSKKKTNKRKKTYKKKKTNKKRRRLTKRR